LYYEELTHDELRALPPELAAMLADDDLDDHDDLNDDDL
jgi:hypothetical protein